MKLDGETQKQYQKAAKAFNKKPKEALIMNHY
jgi:hypothetical protein